MLSTEALPSQRQQLEPSRSSTGSFFAPVNHFLDRPSHHRRHNAARKAREDALIEEANRAATIEKAARSEADQASRGLARSYLEHFLQTSEWQDHIDRIGVVDEAVPTMEELESYGSLDEAEGTRACRKMFKAVVVWEQIGHSLWERLREDNEKTDSRVPRAVGHEAAAVPQLQDSQQAEDAPRWESYHHDHGSGDLHGLSVIKEQPSEPQGHRQPSVSSLNLSLSRGRESSISNASLPHRRGSPTKSSSRSRPGPVIRRSSSVPVSRSSRRKFSDECDCGDDPDHDCPRRATDPGPRVDSAWESDGSALGSGEATLKAAATIPRRLSKSCANAVKRTLEALHDHRGRHDGRESRRASIGC